LHLPQLQRDLRGLRLSIIGAPPACAPPDVVAFVTKSAFEVLPKIDKLSRRMGVPKNYMFLGTPGDRFPHNIAEVSGVRLII
jgi:hypothetical protein